MIQAPYIIHDILKISLAHMLSSGLIFKEIQLQFSISKFKCYPDYAILMWHYTPGVLSLHVVPGYVKSSCSLQMAHLCLVFISLVTSFLGFQQGKPQTVRPMSFTWASHIDATMHVCKTSTQSILSDE